MKNAGGPSSKREAITSFLDIVPRYHVCLWTEELRFKETLIFPRDLPEGA